MDKQKKIETEIQREQTGGCEREAAKRRKDLKRGRSRGTSRCRKNESQYGNVQREE